MSDVSLVDLEVIKRYSLAIRQERAPAEEVLAVLDASRAQILAALEGRGMRRPSGPTRAAYPELTADEDFDPDDDPDPDDDLDPDLDEDFGDDLAAGDPPDDEPGTEADPDPTGPPRRSARRRRSAPAAVEPPVFAPRPWPSD